MDVRKCVCIVDPDAGSRRAEIEIIVREFGFEPTDDTASVGIVGTIGHNPDLENVLRWGKSLKAPVVHYRGTKFSVDAEGHWRFPPLIRRNAEAVRNAKASLVRVLEWFRDGGAPPDFLLPKPDQIGPLLAFGVLLDGFRYTQHDDAVGWLRPAVEAARPSSSPAGSRVVTLKYWEGLRSSEPGIERIRTMLTASSVTSPGFQAVMDEARQYGWLPAAGIERGPADAEAVSRTVYQRACDAVRAAWEVTDGGEKRKGVPRSRDELRELVAQASLGFYVLAAGHL